MSTNMNVACGWGFTTEKFLELTLLDKSDIWEDMWRITGACKELIIPESEWTRIWNEPGQTELARDLLKGGGFPGGHLDKLLSKERHLSARRRSCGLR